MPERHQQPPSRPATSPLKQPDPPAGFIALPEGSAAPTLNPGGDIAPGQHRLPQKYVLLNATRAFFFVFVMGIVTLAIYNAGSALNSLDLFIAFLIVFLVLPLGLALILTYIQYKHFFWEITESEIHINSGTFFKREVLVPLEQLKSINYSVGDLLGAVFGIVQLEIKTTDSKTAQAKSKDKRKILIPALTKAEAAAFERDAFARKEALAQRRQRQNALILSNWINDPDCQSDEV